MQQENDVNCLMNQYLSKIHSLLETYVPLQKINEKQNEISHQTMDYTRLAKFS